MLVTRVKKVRPDRTGKKGMGKNLGQVINEIRAAQPDHQADFFLPAGSQKDLSPLQRPAGPKKSLPIKPIQGGTPQVIGRSQGGSPGPMAKNPDPMTRADSLTNKFQGSGEGRGLCHRRPIDSSLKLGPQIVPPLSLQPGANLQLARQLAFRRNQASPTSLHSENLLVTRKGIVQIDTDTKRESLFQKRASAETIRSTEIP